MPCAASSCPLSRPRHHAAACAERAYRLTGLRSGGAKLITAPVRGACGAANEQVGGASSSTCGGAHSARPALGGEETGSRLRPAASLAAEVGAADGERQDEAAQFAQAEAEMARWGREVEARIAGDFAQETGASGDLPPQRRAETETPGTRGKSPKPTLAAKLVQARRVLLTPRASARSSGSGEAVTLIRSGERSSRSSTAPQTVLPAALEDLVNEIVRGEGEARSAADTEAFQDLLGTARRCGGGSGCGGGHAVPHGEPQAEVARARARAVHGGALLGAADEAGRLLTGAPGLQRLERELPNFFAGWAAEEGRESVSFEAPFQRQRERRSAQSVFSKPRGDAVLAPKRARGGRRGV